MEQQRITISQICRSLIEKLAELDRGLPGALIDLSRRPRKVIDTFLRIDRKQYLHPIRYAFFSLTIYAIYLYFAFGHIETLSIQAGGPADVVESSVRKSQAIIIKYYNLFFFVSIPLMAFFSYILFHRQKDYNYAEHLIIHLYGQSHGNIILVLTGILTIILSYQLGLFIFFSLLSILAYYVYYIFLLGNTTELPLGKAIWKGFLFTFLFFFTALLIGFVYGVLRSVKDKAAELEGQDLMLMYTKIGLMLALGFFLTFFLYRICWGPIKTKFWLLYLGIISILAGLIWWL